MELEELTKTQIILLVLLVSFVTSIATGIVTVSLLAQAPPAITQTVNHVIERTVASVASTTGATTITKETTVVVKEDDLVTKSIADSFAKVGRIHETAATTSPVIALGAILGNGVFLTDAVVGTGTHAVDFTSGTGTYIVTDTFPDIGVTVMNATGTAPSLSSFTIVSGSSIKLGQTVIGLYGRAGDHVAIGTVSGATALASVKAGEGKLSVRSIDTSLTTTLSAGTPLINAFGDLVGISTGVSRAADGGSFVSISDILALMTAGQVQGTSTPAR